MDKTKKMYVGTYVNYDMSDRKIASRITLPFKTRTEAETWMRDSMERVRSVVNNTSLILDDWRNDTDGIINLGGDEITTQHTWQIVECEDPLSGQLNELTERVIEWQKHLENIHAWSADAPAEETAKMAEDEAWCLVRETLREITGDNELWAC